ASPLWSYGMPVAAGGGFWKVGALPLRGLAAISTAPPGPQNPAISRLAISRITPNPVLSAASIRFALPAPGPVSLEVFDIQGRRVATVLHDQSRAAGVQEVALRADGWPNGLYLCRLGAGGATATRKLVVAR